MQNLLPKWLVAALGTLLVIFVAMLIVQKAYDLNILIKNQKPANTISVSADGKIAAIPDLATMTLGVMSQGNTAASVKDSNNQKVNNVSSFIKSQGLDSQDITTSQLSLYPQQDWRGGIAITTGYTANQTLTVKFHHADSSAVANIINNVESGAVNNGANEVQGVYFSFENPDALQQQAQQLAIDNAKKKARALAGQAGLSLGKVVSIAETNRAMPGPIPYAMGGMGMAQSSAKAVSPDVQNGSQDISESMTVTFEIR